MSKYSNELKLEVIKYYKKYGGLKRTANFFHIPSSELVRRWIKKYEKYGTKGLIKNFKISYDGNFKQNVIEYMHKNHLSCAETAFHFNLGNNYISDYKDNILSVISRLNNDKKINKNIINHLQEKVKVKKLV